MAPRIKQWEYFPKSDTIEINKKYEIDLKTGTIWYSWNYAGSRAKPFPSWLFAIRDMEQILRQIDREKARRKKLKIPLDNE